MAAGPGWARGAGRERGNSGGNGNERGKPRKTQAEPRGTEKDLGGIGGSRRGARGGPRGAGPRLCMCTGEAEENHGMGQVGREHSESSGPCSSRIVLEHVSQVCVQMLLEYRQ